MTSARRSAEASGTPRGKDFPHEDTNTALHRHRLERRRCDETCRGNRRSAVADARHRRSARADEYSPGYCADHWCDRGHVLYVLEGELDTELRDGRKFKLKAGMSYQVSDFGDAAHRSSTKTGAKLFIVD
jgi:hypothetical protein